jgi:hypothetical protein
MPKAEVHRLFETPGRLSIQRSPTDFGREYRQCEVSRGFDGCWADVDCLVGEDGVARLKSKAWASLCWSGGRRAAPAS